jgi:hypothetical protein
METTMRFLSIYRAKETGLPPTPEMMDQMNGFVQEMLASGKLLATEGCLPSAFGARVRRDGERVTVTDGPFAEAKEVVAGFALLQADSRDEAVELTRRFLAIAGDGECEVRQVAEFGEACTGEAVALAAADA